MSTDETRPVELSDGDCERLWRMLSEPSADLPLAALDRAVERMRAAEAKLAEVDAYCYGCLDKSGTAQRVLARTILAIIRREETRDE